MVKRTTTRKTKQGKPVEMVQGQSWPLSPAATLGSSMRVKGIFLELRARLPLMVRPALSVSHRASTLAMPAGEEEAYRTTAETVGRVLETIEALPVIPREIEEILSITTAERRRWLEDGRLPSAGTRTVKLRGRARKITFHVFDPRQVEEILDRGMVDEWREADALAKIENRRRAAHQAKLSRSLKKAATARPKPEATGPAPELSGWDAFERDGFLR